MDRRRNFALTPLERNDAKEALQLLDGTGISLLDAARRVLASGEVSRSVSCRLAADRFLLYCLRKNLRQATYNDYEYRLTTFLATWGEHDMASIDRPMLRDWLIAMECAHLNRHNFFRVIRAFFRWAKRQDPPLVSNDPTDGLQLSAAITDHSIAYYSVDQARDIMAAAGPYSAFFALGLFAGVRPSEIAYQHKPPLQWQDIDFDERIIRIPSAVAKTRRARIMENLPGNLWQWLEAYRQDSGPIAPGRSTQALKWIKRSYHGVIHTDGARHSFATYHVAMHNDVALTSLLLGHEGRPTMIHRHYRGLATKAQAKAYFAISPSSEVVTSAQAQPLR